MKTKNRHTTLIRYALSCTASALLWLPLPFVLEYFAPNKTDIARQAILQELPSTLPTYFGAFFVIALIMHRLFVPIVVRLRGGRFWLLPLATLPAAASLVAIFGFFRELLSRQPFYLPSFGVFITHFFYSWFMTMVVVMLFWIWASYPLALLNQFLIRHFLSTPPSPNAPGNA